MIPTKIHITFDDKEIEILKNHFPMAGGFIGICASAVLSYLGVKPNTYNMTHSYATNKSCINRILKRNGINTQVINTSCVTVCGFQKSVRKNDNDCYYIVEVQSHVFLLDGRGRVLVDTAPRYNDTRKIKEITKVFLNKGN